jgi:hypothetical protein
VARLSSAKAPTAVRIRSRPQRVKRNPLQVKCKGFFDFTTLWGYYHPIIFTPFTFSPFLYVAISPFPLYLFMPIQESKPVTGLSPIEKQVLRFVYDGENHQRDIDEVITHFGIADRGKAVFAAIKFMHEVKPSWIDYDMPNIKINNHANLEMIYA